MISQPAHPTLILASSSPRRRDLLTRLGVTFEALASDVNEEARPGEAPEALARRLSQAKAWTVAARRPDALILASDTVVAHDGELLGKPTDAQDAVRMLRVLRNTHHFVITAVTGLAPAQDCEITLVSTSTVWMRAYDEDEIRAYVTSGDPLDKAGAYAIQHPTFAPVARLDGCYSGVMGFPLGHVVQVLTALGVEVSGKALQACQGWRGLCCQSPAAHH
jgi:septum formation protein